MRRCPPDTSVSFGTSSASSCAADLIVVSRSGRSGADSRQPVASTSGVVDLDRSSSAYPVIRVDIDEGAEARDGLRAALTAVARRDDEAGREAQDVPLQGPGSVSSKSLMSKRRARSAKRTGRSSIVGVAAELGREPLTGTGGEVGGHQGGGAAIEVNGDTHSCVPSGSAPTRAGARHLGPAGSPARHAAPPRRSRRARPAAPARAPHDPPPCARASTGGAA